VQTSSAFANGGVSAGPDAVTTDMLKIGR